jgi:hypothetical protein
LNKPLNGGGDSGTVHLAALDEDAAGHVQEWPKYGVPLVLFGSPPAYLLASEQPVGKGGIEITQVIDHHNVWAFRGEMFETLDLAACKQGA